jgi:hypothetical protein
MLGLDTELKQSRFNQEIAEDERLKVRKVESITLLTRQLRRKFGCCRYQDIIPLKTSVNFSIWWACQRLSPWL